MLNLLILLPLIGALIIGFVPNLNFRQVKQGGIATAIACFAVSVALMTQFDIHQSGLQFAQSAPWLPILGLNFSLAVDGLSLPLVVMTNLITLLVALNPEVDQKANQYTCQVLPRPRLFYAMLLLANSGVVGALLAQNLLLFFLFYEVELIPFYLMIVIWGSERREYAATKFLIYTALSGVLILAAFLGISWLTDAGSFEYGAINTRNLPQSVQLTLLGLLLLGFGIKIPLVPLHSWLPDAYVESSAPVSILLGSVLSKLGTYGLIRFAIGLFPETWAGVAPIVATVAAISVLYGAIAAIAQHDIKRMVAYSSIGHMGYVMLGSAALTPLSLVGVIAQMVAHGLILALLFYLVGVIESKVGTRELEQLNGLLNPVRGMPLTAGLLILASMASAGIPGMVGFIAEFMVFQGSYLVYPVPTIVAIIGTGLTAVYFVILLNRTCFGRLDSSSAYYAKVTKWESWPALALTGLIIFLGVQPTWLVRWSEPTANAIAAATEDALAEAIPPASLQTSSIPLRQAVQSAPSLTTSPRPAV
jgi:NAD(P)H-quinone oxidoreductase subunit 4